MSTPRIFLRIHQLRRYARMGLRTAVGQATEAKRKFSVWSPRFGSSSSARHDQSSFPRARPSLPAPRYSTVIGARVDAADVRAPCSANPSTDATFVFAAKIFVVFFLFTRFSVTRPSFLVLNEQLYFCFLVPTGNFYTHFQLK